MYSIICCYINPEKVTLLRKNIGDTIGVPFEFIAFDNRKYNYGICKVYNLVAGQAKFDYLCFVHEDVKFLTSGWGQILAERLRQADCGVVGFAGSICKLKQFTSWNTCKKALRSNYVQYMRGRGHAQLVNPDRMDYSRVVTLDGLCLFVRKDVWQQILFDEKFFSGFHGYDVDFSLGVASKYSNYVAHNVLVEHDSEGSFSQKWLVSMDVLHEKWNSRLPMFVFPVTSKNFSQYERLGEGTAIKFLWQKGCFDRAGLACAWAYWKRYPFKAFSWGLFFKYIKYRLRHAS